MFLHRFNLFSTHVHKTPRTAPEEEGSLTAMPTHFEKTLESQPVYEGRVITVTRDTALLEDGTTAQRDVVHHHGGACILPYFEDGTICMVRQFRYAMQQELWELPAGKLEQGEDPFEAAKRELTEECGVTADEYIRPEEITHALDTYKQLLDGLEIPATTPLTP